MQGIATLALLARNDGQPNVSLRGCLHPRQSRAWSKYGYFPFLMQGIATLALLARNDGINVLMQGIASAFYASQ